MFVTNWISTTKIQKISEITNFFRHYFLSRTEVDYVNMSAVVTEYFHPIQHQLEHAKKAVAEHAKKESVRIKEQMKAFLVKIDQNLQNKLNELKQSMEKSQQTKAEIEKQESDLEWMKGIIERVNGLINF